LESHVLKIGHHGSKTSSGKDFLSQINPQAAIIMCAKDNKYNFPHTETMASLQQYTDSIYRTDTHGTILVLANASSFQVFTHKNKPRLNPVLLASNIDINSAPISELAKIIHIGPATAQIITELRPFTCLDDLKRVRGIGIKKIEDIKSQGLAMVAEQGIN
jgi:competence protein ComEC